MLTEGLVDDVINRFTNTAEFIMYVRVRYSDDGQAVSLEKGASFFVVLLALVRIVPRTVKFNDEVCRRTIKVRNIFTENFLARKANGICAQKVIPKMLFFFGHVLPEHLCCRNNSLVVFSLHEKFLNCYFRRRLPGSRRSARSGQALRRLPRRRGGAGARRAYSICRPWQ